jgi:hypothetical protein
MDSEEKKDDRDFKVEGSKANFNIGRLALSKNICRFELPMDMRKLQGNKYFTVLCCILFIYLNSY